MNNQEASSQKWKVIKKKSRDRLTKLWDHVKRTNTHVTIIPKSYKNGKLF